MLSFLILIFQPPTYYGILILKDLNFYSLFGSNPAYAHLTDSRTQQWIDPEQNVKIQFNYEPEKPLLETPTELKFSIQNLKTGEHLKELFAKVVIINTQGYSKLNNIAVSNGDFSKFHISP